MSGEEFRLKCESDVHASDLYCSRSVLDPVTGESRLAEERDENQVVAGLMWSDEAITMSAVCAKGRSLDGLFLLHLKRMLDASPSNGAFTLHTSSAFLRTEGEKFRELIERGELGAVLVALLKVEYRVFCDTNGRGTLPYRYFGPRYKPSAVACTAE
jgi:hypothetical protein